MGWEGLSFQNTHQLLQKPPEVLPGRGEEAASTGSLSRREESLQKSELAGWCTPENRRGSLAQTPGWAWTEAHPYGQCPYPAHPVLDTGFKVELGRGRAPDGLWGLAPARGKAWPPQFSLPTCGLNRGAGFPEGPRPGMPSVGLGGGAGPGILERGPGRGVTSGFPPALLATGPSRELAVAWLLLTCTPASLSLPPASWEPCEEMAGFTPSPALGRDPGPLLFQPQSPAGSTADRLPDLECCLPSCSLGVPASSPSPVDFPSTVIQIQLCH